MDDIFEVRKNYMWVWENQGVVIVTSKDGEIWKLGLYGGQIENLELLGE
jgi:hypothetical protein